jgi:hypothetical protein
MLPCDVVCRYGYNIYGGISVKIIWMESETLAEMGWVVGFVGVVIVLLPMAFYGVDHRTSVVFLSLTPMGNQTDSSNILMADGKADVLTFQLNSDLSAHTGCNRMCSLVVESVWYFIRRFPFH